MRYRIADLLLFVTGIGVIFGWWSFFCKPLVLEWHERHPVRTLERNVDGQTVVEHRRVLMYYALDEFREPHQFLWVTTRFYASLALQFVCLTAGTTWVCIAACRRWPGLMWPTAKGLCLPLLLGMVLLVFLLPALQTIWLR